MNSIKTARRVCVLLILLACACSRLTAAQSLPLEWHSFRLNPELNPVVSTGAPLAVRWTFKTGGGISSSPTISGDVVFIASNDHRLYALDLRTGRPRWVYTAENEIMSAPLIVGNLAIVGEGNNYSTNFDPPNYGLLADGANGLIGVDASTGKERWKYHLPGSAMPTGAVIDGIIEEHDAAGMLFALNAVDGKYKWRRYLVSAAAMSAANNFTGKEVVTAGDYPNSVIAFDGTTGRTIWHTEFPPDSSASADCPPASDGHAIYGMYFARPADSKYNFVGFTTPGIEHAYAINGSNGKIAWDVPLVRGILPVNNHASIPLIYENTMFVGSPVSRTLFALDVGSGKIKWKLPVRGVVQGGLVGDRDQIYFGDRAGFLWAVDAKTGAPLGKIKMKDKFNVGSPIIVGQTLIIGSGHGYVFAVPIASFTSHK